MALLSISVATSAMASVSSSPYSARVHSALMK
jgi:hypothetical protein